jgi:hypothetical protein
MRYVLVFLLLLGIGGAIESPAHAAPGPRAVSLADASAPPTMLAYVLPGHAFTPNTDSEGRPCHAHGRAGYFSDASAYRWNGSALGAQHWNASALVYYWHARGHVGAVAYDGLTFRNDTRAPILVAGWCEA